MNHEATSDRQSFAERLIAWQNLHGRHDLPWQKTQDPYRIWLSEIMLQQTQVSTVIPYYARFLERFPRIEALAAAPVDSVLELWAGLGYYARARNLHRCAQVIVAGHGGRFPDNTKVIDELPGIGRSTAAAIAAFAFGQRAAILDGNVKRVLARCFGIEGFPGSAQTEKILWTLAESLLPAKKIEVYTQGLMDLGATRCTRSKPFCTACPMHEICIARRTDRQAELPTAKPKKTVPERETNVLLLTDGQHVLLERRPPSGIWGGLLALPEVDVDAAESFASRHGCRVLDTQALTPLRHSFTHFRLTIHPLHCTAQSSTRQAAEPGWEWLDLQDVEAAALPTPIRKLLRLLAGSAAQTAQTHRLVPVG
jgi:A/G-specific adenine glycosylase